jgi:hypothetical protein
MLLERCAVHERFDFKDVALGISDCEFFANKGIEDFARLCDADNAMDANGCHVCSVVVDPSHDYDAQRKGCQPVANFFFIDYSPHMDKATLIRRAGGVRWLATLLGITTQAIYKWRDVPADHLMRLRAIKPHWFRKDRK